MAKLVYSSSIEAAAKQKIDNLISGVGKVAIDMTSEAYLKALIAACSPKGGGVGNAAKGLQFYIVKGGAEGFLDPSFAGKDASRVSYQGGVTTSGQPGTEMVFDENDLICVFSPTGALISSALLRRPLSIIHPNIWSEKTANKVYGAWDNRKVSVYKNHNFDVQYYGLTIDDSLGLYRKRKVMIDLHKEEATNGCIFIRDAATPAYGDAALDNFEPEFILKVQAFLKVKIKHNVGTMHVLDVTAVKP